MTSHRATSTLCAALVLLVGLTAWPLSAETVMIRSGEHPGFTRLVLQPESPHDWQFGRTATGYELRLKGNRLSFDTDGVFHRILRQRISAVEPLPRPGTLALISSCACFAKAAQLSDGKIVIDIVDGTPPANSPFEQPLDEGAVAVAHPLPHPGQARGEGQPRISDATLSYRPTENDAASLPIYWRDILQTTQKPSGEKAESAPPSMAEKPTAMLPLLLPPSIPATDGLPPMKLPSPKVRATEAELLLQLSRAAAQGMVTLAEPEKKPRHAAPPPSAPDGPAPLADEIAFHAETSMDRDANANPMAQHLTAQGQDCVSDEALALTHWGTDESAPEQLTRARAHLTGEFDKPDPEAVRSLARLYLHLGMGAEARQVLRAFSDQSDEARLLNTLGQIIDDQTPMPENPFTGMQDCDTSAALWAFLVRPADTAESVNAAAVVRAFSGLPPPLRAALGPRLSDRFIRAGNPAAARDIRNAMARSGDTTENRNLGMVDASLAEPAQALKKLDQLAKGNDDLAVEAAMAALRNRLDRGEEVDAKQVEGIAALAFEHGDSPLGSELAALEIEARAAVGDYGGAARRLEERQTEYPDTDLRPLTRLVLKRLTDSGDDTAFLQLYFHKSATIDAALTDPAAGYDTLLPIAARLAKLGFPAETSALLPGPAGHTNEGRAILARAALAEFAPDKALGLLDGLPGSDAALLRSEALVMQKNYGAAATQLADIGAQEKLARAYWQSGDWHNAAAQDDRYRAAADGLGLTDTARSAPPDARTGEVVASLSASRTAVADSAALRKTVASLLATPTSIGN